MADRTPSGERSPSAWHVLQVDVEKVDSYARVIPTGDIDLFTAPELDETIGALVGDDAVRRVVVDLAGVTFLDSTGLHALVKRARGAEQDGFDFTVSRPSASVHRLFVLTGMDQVVSLVEQ
jgi:anti-sigma B factor antagonist